MKLLSVSLILFYFLWLQFDDVRTTQISNDTCQHRGFDLLIADFLEVFYVPLISSSAIPKWNKYDSDEIKTISKFAFHFLYDDAHIFFFVLESKNVRLAEWIFTVASEFDLVRDLWDINSMHLLSGVDASVKVCVADNYFKFLT